MVELAEEGREARLIGSETGHLRLEFHDVGDPGRHVSPGDDHEDEDHAETDAQAPENPETPELDLVRATLAPVGDQDDPQNGLGHDTTSDASRPVMSSNTRSKSSELRYGISMTPAPPRPTRT